MTKPVTITLAGKDYEIAALTLRQLRDLEIGVTKTIEDRAELEAKANGGGMSVSDAVALAYKSNVNIVVAGLSRTNPQITADSIFDMETNNAEIIAAANAVLELAGMREPQKGEAEAPAKKAGE